MEFILEVHPHLLSHWNEPWRFWHNQEHLNKLLKDIKELKLNSDDTFVLEAIAFFHDIVYKPWRNDNESKSIEFFINFNSEYSVFTSKQSNIIIEAIERTGDTLKCKTELSNIFRKLDRKILESQNLAELIDYENKIFKEFQCFNYLDYIAGRLNFLKNNLLDSNPVKPHFISYVETKRPNIAIYAGSFNPFHIGHFNILQKAENIFDKVILSQGSNPEKTTENLGEYKRFLVHPDNKVENLIINREHCQFTGLITSEIEFHEQYANVTLLRGLRNGKDLDYEVNQLRFIEEFKPDIKMIFIIGDSEYSHISSSAIKNIHKIDSEKANKYLI